MKEARKYLVEPGSEVRLKHWDTNDDGGMDKADGQAEFAKLHERLIELEALLYAERKHALLVVLQGIDTSGKDSTTRAVFSGLNPASVDVISFKQPTALELSHDFLWRIHGNCPRLGQLVVFNRSHYEDVVVVRVKKLVEEKRWKARYDHINRWEEMLHDEGTIIRKFYLHISKDYQKERLQKRLDDPTKNWKFEPNDLLERKLWDDYMAAYEDALAKCSTGHAPWYVIPAERRWYRDLLITRILVATLESLDMKFPKPNFDPKQYKVE